MVPLYQTLFSIFISLAYFSRKKHNDLFSSLDKKWHIFVKLRDCSCCKYTWPAFSVSKEQRDEILTVSSINLLIDRYIVPCFYQFWLVSHTTTCHKENPLKHGDFHRNKATTSFTQSYKTSVSIKFSIQKRRKKSHLLYASPCTKSHVFDLRSMLVFQPKKCNFHLVFHLLPTLLL